ncbi:unnamed protein product [Enterobius vermicularis]|uniref:SAC domain-containing protein n=1 Tax=Enterobius vermicularis TaxID=51028 RepID=A0A0N4V185_ENTVE|nr:unnamed protein product [Enterobius vermicularis]
MNQQNRLSKLASDKPVSTRIIDEILRLFNNDGDFYVSFGRNLTLNTQRSFLIISAYFFFHSGLFESVINFFYSLTVTMISRRSIERAGVRYLRRGVDVDGNVANFVETEVILTVFGSSKVNLHIRGSVPIFWKQRGFRYRPPLIIDKPMSSSFPAFEKHMDGLVNLYGSPLVAVCLLDQTGRELGLGLSYLQHVLEKDSSKYGYYAFDFHSQCRALRFQKVENLVNALHDQLKTISFCWVDKTNHMACEQSGVVRTNCVDCLDRTNVVQGSISQAVCLLQLRKLGLIGPLSQLPENFVRMLQSMWADNGDAVSRQYAGTNALKGDVTRCGQRGLVGIVRDGYNSASRYYYSHMKDSHRQMTIDALLGRSTEPSTDESVDLVEEGEKEEDESENIGRLVNETARFLLSENEILLAFFEVLLTITFHLHYLKSIQFDELKSIELGPLEGSKKVHLYKCLQNFGFVLLFRIITSTPQYYTLRAPKTRLFNNTAIPMKSEEEANEYVQAIAEQIKTTVNLTGGNVYLTTLRVLGNCPLKRRSLLFFCICIIIIILKTL